MVKSKIAFVLGISIVFIAIMLTLSGCGKEKDPYENSKLFENLSSSDVQAVYLEFGAYEPYKLNDKKDVETLVSLLKEIPIYDKYISDEILLGPCFPVACLIEKTDGTKIKVVEISPYFEIDGVKYNSEGIPCDNLDEFLYPFVEEIRENGKLIENN